MEGEEEGGVGGADDAAHTENVMDGFCPVEDAWRLVLLHGCLTWTEKVKKGEGGPALINPISPFISHYMVNYLNNINDKLN